MAERSLIKSTLLSSVSIDKYIQVPIQHLYMDVQQTLHSYNLKFTSGTSQQNLLYSYIVFRISVKDNSILPTHCMLKATIPPSLIPGIQPQKVGFLPSCHLRHLVEATVISHLVFVNSHPGFPAGMYSPLEGAHLYLCFSTG